MTEAVLDSLTAALSALPKAARDATEELGKLKERLARAPRWAAEVVLRLHPLLLGVRRGEHLLLIAPAFVWDRGRDILRPYAKELAGSQARLLLLV